ncbi:MAG TPA: hypothetical protein PKM97_11730 [Bacteroidia bacterium]|nr:hypothetical protein [Bacteroidia bacterium]
MDSSNIKDVLISISLLFVLAVLGCSANSTESKNVGGYDLSDPDELIVLPDILREVSGLTDIDNNTFACIQDEDGILFIYDIHKNDIHKQYNFHVEGDYEGITRVDSTMYILRSDGVLFEISNYQNENFSLTSYQTGIPANNNEGLCYDPDHNRLLIASKGRAAKGPQYKDKRVIYGFDLKTKKLTTDPVFDFDLQAIKQYAIDKKIEIPLKTLKKANSQEPFIRFMTSAIAVHPVSKKLYLLSAADHLFFIFNMNGEVEYIEKLDASIFNKAEGITFMDNGDMLITNEGQNGRPTLLRFNSNKN